MKPFVKVALTALALLALLACTGKEDNKPKEPTRFTLSGVSAAYSAESQTVTAYIVCDVNWVAKLDANDWSAIESQVSNNDNGQITLRLQLNSSTQARTAKLTVTAGTSSRQVTIKQDGLSSIVSSPEVNFAGADPLQIEFNTKTGWSASIADNATWYDISPKSGAAGKVAMTITPADENINVGSRSSSIKVNIGEDSFFIPVVQGQKDVVILDGDYENNVIWHGYAEGSIVIPVKTNIDYDIRIEGGDGWLTAASTKALNSKSVTLQFQANSSFDLRDAVVYFEKGSLSLSVAVKQAGYNTITDSSTPCFNGFTDSKIEYRQYTDQLSVLHGLEFDTFRLFDPVDYRIVEISGLPKELSMGSVFTGAVTIKEYSGAEQSQEYEFSVVKLTTDYAWLASSNNMGVLIKRP